MKLPPDLKCPTHEEVLGTNGASGRVEDAPELVCPRGCRFPIVNEIPRFVKSEHYASAFGKQWNVFSQTQLDSYTKQPIFVTRLTRALGESLETLRGKSVLEAGCGAGNFTELFLAAGAHVFACDLSSAVDANYANHRTASNFFICQADIQNLPVASASFDYVMCLGVIQHTPNPERTISALAQCVKPGGTLVIDHYAPNYPYPLSRRILRPVLLFLPAAISTRLAMALARVLLQIHKLTWNQRRGIWRLRGFLKRHSPLVDLYDDLPQLGTKLLGEWSVLVTHDTLTDRYKHLRSVEQIRECLEQCGMTEIDAYYGGNGVEARAKRPMVIATQKSN